jgi:hypothetical protein
MPVQPVVAPTAYSSVPAESFPVQPVIAPTYPEGTASSFAMTPIVAPTYPAPVPATQPGVALSPIVAPTYPAATDPSAIGLSPITVPTYEVPAISSTTASAQATTSAAAVQPAAAQPTARPGAAAAPVSTVPTAPSAVAGGPTLAPTDMTFPVESGYLPGAEMPVTTPAATPTPNPTLGTGNGGPTGAMEGCGCGGMTTNGANAAPGARKHHRHKSKGHGKGHRTGSADTTATTNVALRNRILKAARSQLGVDEDAGENRDKAGRIASYRKAVAGADPNSPSAWCAFFVSWVTKQAGAEVMDGRGSGLVRDIGDWAKRTGRYLPSGSNKVQPGDVVFFREPGGTLNWTNHTGIVESIDPDGTIHTIEGNASDSVERNEYSANDGSLRGFASMG